MEYRLLEKTELWVSPVRLKRADLRACAAAAARVLSLSRQEIMVTDVFENRLTLDILVPTIRAEQIIAREKPLLEALATVPGVEIMSETKVHSEGILGLISMDETVGQETIRRSRDMAAQISYRIQRRSMVFATGEEVRSGKIRDTNTPFLIAALEAEGHDVAQGPVLEDKASRIARAFRLASEAGYGLLATTGGIGAEGKDQTLEALTQVDAQAYTPYVLKFRKGQGRHDKDGVRIGVGRLEQTLIVCLPGPHDEVQLVWPVLRKGLKAGWNEELLARSLARALREKFLARSGSHHDGVEEKFQEVIHGSIKV